MILNITNHPVSQWSMEQLQAAAKIGGEVIDLQFPNIPSSYSEEDIQREALYYFNKALQLNPTAVVVQGEFSFTFALVSMLKKGGIPCYAACSERCSKQEVQPDGTVLKKSHFAFVRFREYTC